MSRQIPEGGHEKLVANTLGVATQGIPIATRTRFLHQNFVATFSKSVHNAAEGTIWYVKDGRSTASEAGAASDKILDQL